MESISDCFGGRYAGRTVLVTGHTGFKGSWLMLWLTALGAKVTGYALEPPTQPNHIGLLDLPIDSRIADVRDRERLAAVVAEVRPEIVFHMAAQPLVRASYRDPVTTIETNVVGTMNVMEACRAVDSVRALVLITSDKCYENREWVWGYRESDAMGGYDPYSASKGAAELIANAWLHSYFNVARYGDTHQTLMATVRAGNVIGGGDWAGDRLVPDIARAAGRGEVVEIRSPRATRPWQFVLEPLSGYLHLGTRLLDGETRYASPFNFGPNDSEILTVGEMVTESAEHWPAVRFALKEETSPMHEATLLKLDISKAHLLLQWRPAWDGRTAIRESMLWYRDYYEHGGTTSKARSMDILERYVAAAREQRIAWSIAHD